MAFPALNQPSLHHVTAVFLQFFLSTPTEEYLAAIALLLWIGLTKKHATETLVAVPCLPKADMKMPVGFFMFMLPALFLMITVTEAHAVPLEKLIFFFVIHFKMTE